jgi:hypothetical protein
MPAFPNQPGKRKRGPDEDFVLQRAATYPSDYTSSHQGQSSLPRKLKALPPFRTSTVYNDGSGPYPEGMDMYSTPNHSMRVFNAADPVTFTYGTAAPPTRRKRLATASSKRVQILQNISITPGTTIPANSLPSLLSSPQPIQNPNLAPCYRCHKAPKRRSDLDSFTNCSRLACQKRTCFICLRSCEGCGKTICAGCCVESGALGDVCCFACLQKEVTTGSGGEGDEGHPWGAPGLLEKRERKDLFNTADNGEEQGHDHTQEHNDGVSRDYEMTG